MEKNLEIKKLSGIAEWADNLITAAGYYEEKYKSDATSAYCNVKAYELWRIRDVALKAIERHSVYTNALNEDIASKDAKIDLLEKEIEGHKEGYAALKELVDKNYIPIGEHNKIVHQFEEKVAKLEKESEKWQDLAKMNRDTICDQYSVCEDFKKKIAELEKELADCKVKIRHQKENLDGINKTLEIRTKENESLIKVKNNQEKEIEAHETENHKLEDRIKYWKTHCLAAEEARDAFMKEVEELRGIKEDDHGRAGFKRYIEYLIEEEEAKVPERFKARLNEEITAIFEKEEETEVKGVGRTSSGRYPWGAKVNDIPCSVYRRIKELSERIRTEVDKKRIVDIGDGAEKILGVSRELFDAAIKALVDFGYQEIIGRIPQATNSSVLMDIHVLATPDVETKETANAENIKSLDFDIPCGEDAIE